VVSAFTGMEECQSDSAATIRDSPIRTVPRRDSLSPAPSGGEGVLVLFGDQLSEPKVAPLHGPVLPRREEREFIVRDPGQWPDAPAQKLIGVRHPNGS
jgi:hypothetical protein